MSIIALTKSIPHDATRATLSNNVLRFYGVDLLDGQTHATLAGTVSVLDQTAHANGREN